MKKTIASIILAVVFLAANAQAQAETYWVSPVGQAGWANCRGSVPFDGTSACSLATANQNAVAGDTVYLRGGAYNAQSIMPSNSGFSGQLITFTAYNSEDVQLTNQLAANQSMESEAWPAFNGATVERSNAQSWDGAYSTKFTVTAQGQGIKSQNFSVANEHDFSAYIYSDQSAVHVRVDKGDGSGILWEKDFPLAPNKWVSINNFSNFNGAGGDKASITFTSPIGMASGTWYVDDVRMRRYQPSIYIYNKDYIKVNDVHVANAFQGFYLLNSADFNEISNSSFTDIDSYMANAVTGNWNTATAPSMPSTYNWIHHNTFHDNGYVVWRLDTNKCWECGNQLRIGATGKSDTSSYNLIEDNLFYHAGHDHILLETRYNTVRNNVFHNEGWMRNHYGLNGCGPDSSGANPPVYNNPTAGFGARNLLFENPANNSGYNLVEGNRLGYAGTPPVHDGANGIENPTDGNIFRYNFMYGNGTTGYYFKQQSGDPDYNRIYNNTIYANGGGEDIDPMYQAGIKCNCWQTSFQGNAVKNNIIFNNAMGSIRPGNCSVEAMTVLNVFTNNLENDPRFANPDMSDKYSLQLPDLSLLPGSAAIDTGVELTKVASLDTGIGTFLVINDASYFQDGSWGPPGRMQADWIAVGNVNNVVSIFAIDYTANTLTLTNAISRNAGDAVWLYKDSSGRRVLYGLAPDVGASEYVLSILYGDVSENGSVTAYDASLGAQYSVGLITLTQSQITKADVSGNGSITAYDASLIAQYAVGLITKFPVQG